MSNCLLSIGSFPERALSTISSAFSCGAVNSVSHLDIFQLSFRDSGNSPAAYLEALSRGHDVLSPAGGSVPVFPAGFSFSSCTAVLPSAREFAADPESEALLAAAREGDIPYTVEVMGRNTGTDADMASVAGAGKVTGLVSIPLRNMHTPVEVVDERDILAAARLLVRICGAREQK